MTAIDASTGDTGCGFRWHRPTAAEPAGGLQWAQRRAAQSAARGHPALPRRRRGAGGAAQRRRAQLLRRRRYPHLRIQGHGSAAVSARGDGLAAVGDLGADPAARAGGHGGAGFRRRRGRAGPGLCLRHRRRGRVREILLRSGAGGDGPRWRVVGDADPTRRLASGAADTAAQSRPCRPRRRATSVWSPRRCPTTNCPPGQPKSPPHWRARRLWPCRPPNAWCGTG